MENALRPKENHIPLLSAYSIMRAPIKPLRPILGIKVNIVKPFREGTMKAGITMSWVIYWPPTNPW